MKIIILNFETGEVHVYPYEESAWEDCIAFLESDEINLNSDTCQWMVVDEVNIKVH